MSSKKSESSETQPVERKRIKVESTFADKWDPENKGDTLEGIYLGSEQANGNRGELFTVYHILHDDGKRWSIAGAYLDTIMKQIPRNAYVFVTYDGMATMKTGNKMKLFSVEVAEGTKLHNPYNTQE